MSADDPARKVLPRPRAEKFLFVVLALIVIVWLCGFVIISKDDLYYGIIRANADSLCTTQREYLTYHLPVPIGPLYQNAWDAKSYSMTWGQKDGLVVSSVANCNAFPLVKYVEGVRDSREYFQGASIRVEEIKERLDVPTIDEHFKVTFDDGSACIFSDPDVNYPGRIVLLNGRKLLVGIDVQSGNRYRFLTENCATHQYRQYTFDIQLLAIRDNKTAIVLPDHK